MNSGALILLTLLLLMLSGVIAFFALIRNRVRAHHRVDPSVPADAPLSWTFDPRHAARLHRRLTRVGTATTRIVEEQSGRRGLRRRRPEPTATHAAARDLRDHAVALDREISRIAILPAPIRKEMLVDLAGSVEILERATGRLVSLHARVGGSVELSGEPVALDRIAEEIDLLSRAHEELQRIDRQHGLETRPSMAETVDEVPYPRPIRRVGEDPGEGSPGP